MSDRNLGRSFAVALLLAGPLPACAPSIRAEQEDAIASGTSPHDPTSPTSETQVPQDGATDTPGEGDEDTESSSSGRASTDGSDSANDGGGALCGDGIIQGLEECDCGEGNICAEKELGGIGCVALDPDLPGVVTGGVLLCNGASCRYDTSSCFYCGDGYLNGNEACEEGFEFETSCAGLKMGLGEVSCGDDCQLDTSDCNACGFIFDFDTGECPGDWTTGRTTNAAAPTSWECGASNGFDGGPGFGASRKWGTNLAGAYQGNASGYFASAALNLDECSDQDVTMTITHWFSFGTGDGGIVQVATADPDEEASWTTIDPVSGSFYSATVAGSHPPVAGNPEFSTFDPAEQTWVDAVFDITDYAGEDEFYIRFVFGSDGSSVSGGWYIDTIGIVGTPR
ncbi:MAG: hypothetical protein KUG77_22275 [Nannocystaceae bacterium]|nr:hypothetical protein [Nannocystaceae bacterium]